MGLFLIIQTLSLPFTSSGSLSRRDRIIWARHDRVVLTAPIDHYFIVSNFGIRRDPFNGRLAFHAGLDLSNALLSPVLSTSPGVVVYVGWMGGYGRLVEIDHGLGVHTRYGHLARIDVKVGDTVHYRQQIGLLGSSGRSNGPHVHYEVLVNGRPLDPMNFLKAGRYVFKG